MARNLFMLSIVYRCLYIFLSFCTAQRALGLARDHVP